MRSWSLALVCVPIALASCAESMEDRACPPSGTALRWQTFGEPFFERHCQRCHSAEGSARVGSHHGGYSDVPAGYDFSTVENVRIHKERIFLRSAGENSSMPPGPNDPSTEEREKLAEWLVCGAP